MICFSYGMVHYIMVGPNFQGVCVLLKLPSVGIMCSFSIILYILVNENLEIAVKNAVFSNLEMATKILSKLWKFVLPTESSTDFGTEAKLSPSPCLSMHAACYIMTV